MDFFTDIHQTIKNKSKKFKSHQIIQNVPKNYERKNHQTVQHTSQSKIQKHPQNILNDDFPPPPTFHIIQISMFLSHCSPCKTATNYENTLRYL